MTTQTESPLDRICREARERVDYILAHPGEFTTDEVARAEVSKYQRDRLNVAAILRYGD